jgi:predicted outer membrane protein
VDTTRHGRVATALLVLLAPLSISILTLGVVAPAVAAGQPALTDADKQLLIKVRQVGLWAVPASELAQQQAESEAVRDVGVRLAEQHQVLDEQVQAVAKQFGVTLPDQPSEEQQGWLADLTAKVGPEFDKSFAQLLRAANGSVLSVVAQVRAGTRNDVIRDFAQKANDAVTTHMTLLEGTGQVDFNALPEPALAGDTPAGAQGSSAANASSLAGGGGGLSGTVAVLICVLVFVLTLGLVRVIRAR